MKKFFLVVGYALFILGITGCASLKSLVDLPIKFDKKAPLSPYSGPQAMIAVADFEIQSPKATSQIGAGLREMLITALNNSNRFLIIERREVTDVKQKKESAASATQTVNEAVKPKNADLVIAITVGKFEPQVSGGRAGVGGGGGAESGAFGGLLGSSLSKAHIALDIRIVNTSTSKILAYKSVQGQASDIGGDLMSDSTAAWALGTGLSTYANTPMEKAMRVCIMEAGRYISQTIPANYYKY